MNGVSEQEPLDDSASADETVQEPLNLLDVAGTMEWTYRVDNQEIDLADHKFSVGDVLTIELNYTLDNTESYQIDGETTLFVDFPEAFTLTKVENGEIKEVGGSATIGYYDIIETEDGGWRIEFSYLQDFLDSHPSNIAGFFRWNCTLNEKAQDEEKQETLTFPGTGHQITINYKDSVVTADKTYLAEDGNYVDGDDVKTPAKINDDGTVTFRIELNTDKKATNVTLTDTMGAGLQFVGTAFELYRDNSGEGEDVADTLVETFTVAPEDLKDNIITLNIGTLEGGSYYILYNARVVGTDSLTNKIVWDWEGGTTGEDTTTVVIGNKAEALDKKRTSNEESEGKQVIKWTITVNDTLPRLNLNNATLTDVMTVTDDAPYTVENVLVKVRTNGTYVEYTGGQWDEAQEVYTFGPDAGYRTFQITYVTSVDRTALTTGDYTATNTVTLQVPDHEDLTDSDTATWNVKREATVELDGEKQLLGAEPDEWPDGTEFTFTLQQVNENGVPVKDGTSLEDTATPSDRNIHFEIKYTAAGDYYYTLREVPGDDGRIAYDEKEYRVHVKVEFDSETGNLSVTQKEVSLNEPEPQSDDGASDPAETPDFTFTNTYNKVTLPLKGKKTLNSDESLAAGAFTFILEQKQEDGTYKRVATATNDAEGNVAFENLVYDQEDTYTYLLYEKDEGDKTVIYDSTRYKIVVEIEGNGEGINRTLDFKSATIWELNNAGEPIGSGQDLLDLQAAVPFTFENVKHKITFGLDGIKTLNYTNNTDLLNDFTFTIVSTDSDFNELASTDPLYYKAENIKVESSGREQAQDGSWVAGNISYPPITLPIYGTGTNPNRNYYFLVTENNSSGIYYYDVSKYQVTVKVENWEVTDVVVKKFSASGNSYDNGVIVTDDPDSNGRQDHQKLDFENALQKIGPGPGPGMDTEIFVNKIVNGRSIAPRTDLDQMFTFVAERLNIPEDGSFTGNLADVEAVAGETVTQKLSNGQLRPLNLNFDRNDLDLQDENDLTHAKTYYYRLYEQQTNAAGVTYDQNVFYFKVIVSEDQDTHKLHAKALYVKEENGKLVEDTNKNNAMTDSDGNKIPELVFEFKNKVYHAQVQFSGIKQINTKGNSITAPEGIEQNFTYTLQEYSPVSLLGFEWNTTIGNPMPVTTDENGNLKFTAIDYYKYTRYNADGSVNENASRNDTGIHYYQLIEDKQTKVDGVTYYDETVYYIRVEVSFNENGTVEELGYEFSTDPDFAPEKTTTVDANGTANKKITFTNIYSEVKLRLSVSGSKTVLDVSDGPNSNEPHEGADLTKYKFALYKSDANSTQGVKLDEEAADKDGDFTLTTPEQVYKAAGSYYYLVKELSDTETGVTNTDETHLIQVVVDEDADHQLYISSILLDGNKQLTEGQGSLNGVCAFEVTGADFTNTFNRHEVPPKVKLEKSNLGASYEDGTIQWQTKIDLSDLTSKQKLIDFKVIDTFTLPTDKTITIDGVTYTLQMELVDDANKIKVQREAKNGTTDVPSTDYSVESTQNGFTLSFNNPVGRNANEGDQKDIFNLIVTYSTRVYATGGGETIDLTEYIAAKDGQVDITNHAKVEYIFPGWNGEFPEDDADQTFYDLIDKSSKPVYEVTLEDGTTEKRVDWTITVNPYGEDMSQFTTLTVTDTLPEGLEYVTGSAKVGEQATEPTVDSKKNTLTWSGIAPNDTSSITITYTTRVTPEAYNPENNPDDPNDENAANKYILTNSVSLGAGGGPIGGDESDVTVVNVLLDKSAILAQNPGDKGSTKAYQATYTIKVNKTETQMLPTNGNKKSLTLTDDLPAEVNLDTDTIHVYQGDSDELLLGVDVFTERIYDSEKKQYHSRLTVEGIPDATYARIEYTVTFNLKEGQQVTLENNASLQGEYTIKTSHSQDVWVVTSDAGASGERGTLYLQKTAAHSDSTGSIPVIQGAEFKLYEYALTDDGQVVKDYPQLIGTYTTDSSGRILFGAGDETNKLKLDTVYRFEEVNTPNGYILDSAPHYFVLPGDDTDELKAKVQKCAELKNAEIEYTTTSYGPTITVTNQEKTTSITFAAIKELKGAALTADQFSFRLVQTNENWTNEIDSTEQIKTNQANGTVEFDPITYRYDQNLNYSEGDKNTAKYYYILQEVITNTTPDANDDWIEQDQTIYHITVTVTQDEDGDLHAQASYATAQEDVEDQSYTPENGAVKFVNRKAGLTEISGRKVWEDNNNEAGHRPAPEKVTLTLWRYTEDDKTNAEQVENATPDWKNTATDTWTWTYSDLPKYDAEGQRYTYYVVEEDMDYYKPVYSNSNANADATAAYNGGTITNELTHVEVSTDFNAKKYYYGVTEGKFTFTLAGATVNGDDTITPRSTGAVHTGNQPIVDDGVSLLPVVNAEVTMTGTEKEKEIDFGVTFKYEKPGTYYYTIKETSTQQGNIYSDPSTYLVTVVVKRDSTEPGGLKATTTYLWTLDGTHSTGENTEQLGDKEVPAFYNNEVMVLSMDGAFVEITGEKIWESDDTQLAVEDDQFRFYLYEVKSGYTKGEQYLADQTLKPLASASTKASTDGSNATFTFYYSISDIPADGKTMAVVEENAGKTIDGITYSNDVKIVTLRWNDDNTDVEVDAKGITGDNAFANTSAVSIQVTKEWEDEEGTNLTHDPVTVYLYANGEEKQVREIELSEGNKWTHTWKDLPARDEDGNKIVYTVGEEPVDYYTTTITDVTKEDSGVTQSYLITNTFNAEGTVSIDPKITKRVEGRDEGETMTAGEFTFQLADDNGTVLSTATNDAEGNVLFKTIRYTEEDIGSHTYTITEVAGSDPHFDYDDSVIQLQVTVARDEANPTQLVTTTEYLNPATDEKQTEFVNTYYPIILAVQKTSKDGSNDPLPGAIYGLWMVSETGGEDVYLGNCVADENGYMYFREGIEIGPRYYFKEEFAPEGHTVDEYPSVTFRVEKTDSGYQLVYDADNRLAKNAPSPTAEDGLIDEDLQAIVLEFKDGAVGVQDEVTKLYVNKLDTNTREPVTGAVLQIIEKDTGTVVYQWTSGETTQGMERVLNVDTTYILREVTAPDGYDKAEDTEFIFDAYGNLTVLSGADAEWVGDTTINLYNTKRDVTITRQVTDEVVRQVRQVAHVVRTIPQTGDGAPIVLVASLSLCGVLLIVYLQERKRANRKDR